MKLSVSSFTSYFNSHAHVERDMLLSALLIPSKISTHTLTWSVTDDNLVVGRCNKDFNSHAHVERDAIMFPSYVYFFISTHTLTWSVTSCLAIRPEMLSFQLTRSRGA